MEQTYIHLKWENYKNAISSSAYKPKMSVSEIYHQQAIKAKKNFERKTKMSMEEFQDLTDSLQAVYNNLQGDYYTKIYQDITQRFQQGKIGIKKNQVFSKVLKNRGSKEDIEKIQNLITIINEFNFELQKLDWDFILQIDAFNKKNIAVDELVKNSFLYSLSSATYSSYYNLVNLIGSVRQRVDEVAAELATDSISEIKFDTFSKSSNKNELVAGTKTKSLDKDLLSVIDGYMSVLVGAYFEYALSQSLGNLTQKHVEVTGGVKDEKGLSIKTDVAMKYKDNVTINLSIKGGGKSGSGQKFGKRNITYKQTTLLQIINLLMSNNVSDIDIYKYVLYNAVAHAQEGYGKINTLTTSTGSNNHINNLRIIGALISLEVLGADIDFIMYKTHFFSVENILTELSQQANARKYWLSFDLKTTDAVDKKQYNDWAAIGPEHRVTQTISAINGANIHIKI